jgi:hypothetical protein
MTYLAALIAGHAILATLGFAGLIATNVGLLMSYRFGAAAIPAAIGMWRRSVRIFGPLLGAGMLAGIFLATQVGVSLTSLWLLVAYALILATIAAQAGIMIPWQFRALKAAQAGATVSTTAISAAIAVFTCTYIGIMLLMLVRPISI